MSKISSFRLVSPEEPSIAPQPLDNNQYKSRLTLTGVFLCFVGAVFYLYEYYLRVAPSIMADDLQAAFNLSQAAFGHLAGFYYYAYTPMQIPAGIAMDRFGPRTVLTVASLFCLIGTLLFSNQAYLWLAQLGRFLVGFGSAFGYVGVLKLASDWLPTKYFAITAGICTALGSLGGILGLKYMTTLVQHFGWQKSLWGSAWVGLFIALLTGFFLKKGQKTPSLETKHIASISPAAGLNFKDIGRYLFSRNMLQNPVLWINGLIGAMTYLPVSVFAELWAVPYFKTRGFEPRIAASMASVALIGFGLGGPIWGIVSAKIRSRKKLLGLGSLLSACFLSSLLYDSSHSALVIMILLFLASFFASVEVLVFAVSHDVTPARYSATAAAFTNMLVMLGGALLQPLVGVVLDLFTQYCTSCAGHGMATSREYNLALTLLPLSLFCAALLSSRLPEIKSGTVNNTA